MLAEEVAIWAIVGVALLLVAAIIWRGEAMPKIETYAHENRPDYRNSQVGDAGKLRVVFSTEDSDEKAWLAVDRYGNDGGGQLSPSPHCEEVGDAKKVEAPVEGSLEGVAQEADALTSAKQSQ